MSLTMTDTTVNGNDSTTEIPPPEDESVHIIIEIVVILAPIILVLGVILLIFYCFYVKIKVAIKRRKVRLEEEQRQSVRKAKINEESRRYKDIPSLIYCEGSDYYAPSSKDTEVTSLRTISLTSDSTTEIYQNSENEKPFSKRSLFPTDSTLSLSFISSMYDSERQIYDIEEPSKKPVVKSISDIYKPLSPRKSIKPATIEWIAKNNIAEKDIYTPLSPKKSISSEMLSGIATNKITEPELDDKLWTRL